MSRALCTRGLKQWCHWATSRDNQVFRCTCTANTGSILQAGSPGTVNRSFDISVLNEGVDMGVKGQTLVINVTQQEKSPKFLSY